jgi:intracellular septation protein
VNSKVKLLLDFGPLAAFFLAYRFGAGQQDERILTATGALIACSVLALAITYIVEKRIAMMPLISGVLVTVLGGMTLYLKDETFIKMKPTFVNLLFAAILLGGVYFKKPMLKYVLSDAIHMREEGWVKFSWHWGAFFVFLAALNEFIWRHFPTDFWVNFKVFGMLTLTILFTASQIPLIQKYWVEEGDAVAK